jgi:hypothetical protein
MIFISLRQENLLNVFMLLELPVLPLLFPLAFFIPVRGNSWGEIFFLLIALFIWVLYGRLIGIRLERTRRPS